MEDIKRRLQEMRIGGTRVIRDTVVTRWSADTYETDTWNRKNQTLQEAAEVILRGKKG